MPDKKPDGKPTAENADTLSALNRLILMEFVTGSRQDHNQNRFYL